MHPTRLRLSCLCLLTLCTSAAEAKKVVRPCDPQGTAYAAANAELNEIHEAIGKLGPAGEFQPVVDRIRKLAHSECFALLGGVRLAPQSALALRTYWQSGGHSRLRDALDWGVPGPHYVWVEPSVRQALTSETAPHSPLRTLLCPAGDETCGAETRGWELRAAAAFEQAGDRDAARHKAEESRRESERWVRASGDDCSEAVKKLPAHRQFVAYRDCLDQTVDQRVALPIGHLRAPTRGWLVVSGRRGHYHFCDETRAYHLGTGAAFRVGTCTSLALLPGGSVDHRATDDGRHEVIELGHVPVEALREAAWMLLLMDQVDRRVRVAGWAREVPHGVAIMENRSSGFLGHLMGWAIGGTFTSADTTLHWRVADGDADLKTGKLTWPEERNEAERHHALTLLKVAEAGFQRGCPEAAPPAALTQNPPLSAHQLDADTPSLNRAATAIQELWRQALLQQLSCARP